MFMIIHFIIFFFNPYPLNILGFEQIYFDSKNFYSEKFPYIFLFPLSLSDLTQFIGVGILIIFFC